VIRHSGNLLFDVEENTVPGGKPRRFVVFMESVIVSPAMAVGGKCRPVVTSGGSARLSCACLVKKVKSADRPWPEMPEWLLHLLLWTVAILVLAMTGVMLALQHGWIQM
jgi:hypothetical protein